MQKVFDKKTLTINFADSYLRNYSHIKIGEKTDYLFIPNELSDLAHIIEQANKANLGIIPLGRGSNILFGNSSGKVIVSEKKLPKMLNIQENSVIASANININYLIKIAAEKNLGGLEFLAGIPAHLGGIIKTNAGAFGSKIANFIDWVKIVNNMGEIERLQSRDVEWGYHQSNINGFIFQARLIFNKNDISIIKNKIKTYICKRKQIQPLEYPNLGSIFKNPKDTSAGKLIESVGLKGMNRGDAKISDKHANIFINTGNATFSEMEYLIDLAREKVEKKYGIHLETDIEVIN